MTNLIKPKTAATLLNRNRSTIYYWIKEGKLSHERIDGALFVYLEEVERIKNER